MLNLRKVLNLNYVYEFILNLRITQLLWPTYMIVMGYSLLEVAIAESVYHICSFIFELPTGMISDLYGRKFSRMLGRIVSIIEIVLMIYANNIFVVYLSFGLSAISGTLESGTDSAYVYDLLLKNKQEDTFSKIAGIREIIFQSAGFVGMMIGGFIADFSYKLAYVIALVFILSSMVPLMKMPEIKNEKYEKTNILKDISYQFKISYQTFKQNPNILTIMMSYAIFSSFITCVHFYLTNYYKDMNLSMTFISMLMSLENIISIFAGAFTYKLIKKLSKKTVLLVFPLIISVGLFGIAYFPISILAMMMIGFMESVLYISANTYLNEMIESDVRATVLSSMSLLFSISMIIFFPILGLIGDHYGLKLAFNTLAVLGLFIYMIYGYIVYNHIEK